MDDTGDDPEPEQAPTNAAAAKQAGRPWYRRGIVWFWFVIASSAAAVALSYWAEDRLYSFDVDPSDPQVVAFCERIGEMRETGLRIELGGEDTLAEQRHALDQLTESAPTEIRGDLAELVVALERIEQLAADETIDAIEGLDELGGRLDEIADEHRVASRRIDTYVETACA